MNSKKIETLRVAIRDIPDFPKPGIIFKDITPVLGDPALFCAAMEFFVEKAQEAKPTKIAGIEARGFLFGAVLAKELGLPFVPIRKKGKLPYKTISQSYDLEYGQAEIEMHEDALQAGDRVVVVDDLLATGGTAAAAAALIKKVGAEVAGIHLLIELAFLDGRKSLSPHPVETLLVF